MNTRHVLVAILATTMLFAGISAVTADTDDHERSLEDALSAIRTELGIGPDDPIDPERVSPGSLETLGDAVMSDFHSDPDTHEWMDTMMGGEGSESLASAHRWMGYRYLSGGYWNDGAMGGGMMGSGMMGGGFGRWGMMGNPDVPFSNGSYVSPEDTVRRRYAAGDITRRQYRRLMRRLDDRQ